ncbi:MAG: RNA polymerase sigma factor [Bacteroidota bacterium]
MKKDTLNLGLIIAGCQKGNRASQERLYKYYHPYGMSISLRYAKNRLEAREILNESFLKVFTKLDQYDKTQDFQYWLRRIIINTAIDYYRKHQRSPFFMAIDNALQIADDTPVEIELNESVDTLPIIQQLPPAYRMVFNLYVMEGFKHREIAEQLGISVNTSKSNLARAKQKLKALIGSRDNYQSKYKEHG